MASCVKMPRMKLIRLHSCILDSVMPYEHCLDAIKGNFDCIPYTSYIRTSAAVQNIYTDGIEQFVYLKLSEYLPLRIVFNYACILYTEQISLVKCPNWILV